MTRTPVTGRDMSFDIAKFVAIFLVVFGHVSGKLCAEIPTWLSNFIVGINMPLFFAISGYFASSTLDRLDAGRLVRHVRSYFWPLAFVSVCFAVLAWPLDLLASPTTSSTNPLVLIPIYAVKRFLFAGWFLWSLAIMYVSAFVACLLATKFNVSRWVVLAMSYGVMLLIPEWVWYMGYTRSQYVFFLFGAFGLRRSMEVFPCQKVYMSVGLLIGYLSLAICFPSLNTIGLSFYEAKTSIYSMVASPRELMCLGLRFLFALPAIVGLIVLFRSLPNIKILSIVSSLGSTTLGVYILHQWILDRMVEMQIIDLSLWKAFGVSVGLFAFCHVVVCISLRGKIRTKLIWGKS